MTDNGVYAFADEAGDLSPCLFGATLLFGIDGEGGEVLLACVDDEVVGPEHFSSRAVRYLHLGPCVRDASIPRTGDALLDRVTIDPRNPHLSTDGISLFTADGTILLRCLANVRDYRVPEGCTRIENEAFAYNTVINSIEMPEEVSEIGKRAFIGSRLQTLRLPSSMRSIGVEAFARNQTLRALTLNEGLLEIGDGAFSGCVALDALAVPASVRRLGSNVFTGCRLVAGGPDPELSIHPDNSRYFIDANGVLYRRGARGLTLINALDEPPAVYRAQMGTVLIEEDAFAHRRSLISIELPEGVREIGDRAFLECNALTSVALPRTLQSIGDKAFFHTALKGLRLPASLERLGDLALLPLARSTARREDVVSAVYAFRIGSGLMVNTNNRLFQKDRGRAPSNSGGMGRKAFVETEEENPRFCVDSGFLCEIGESNATGGRELKALQYVEDSEVVAVPHDATYVEAYALYGASRIRELRLHDGIAAAGKQALTVTHPLDCLQIDEAHGGTVLLYPALNSYGVFAQNQAFAEEVADFARLIELCDASLSRMHANPERTLRIIARLDNGQKLSDELRAEFEAIVREELDDVVARSARADGIGILETLMRIGIIDGENILHEIEVANAAGGVAATHLLLEGKRTRFGTTSLDLEL